MIIHGIFVESINGTDADPRLCTPNEHNHCHQKATCTQVTPHVCACNPADSYRCICDIGFIGDGLNCSIGELQPAVAET